ncbi:Glycosyltransferase AglI [uncultured archaeon]|nr:Glycosyltransferase AglI [uncultured archaeon]
MIEQILSVVFVILITIYSGWIFLMLKPAKRGVCYSGSFPSTSVVVPAHNEEKYIEATLESVLDSDYPAEFEVLVVDDGSTDRTEEVIKRMAANDSRIRLLKGSHGGKSMAINLASKSARYGILVVIDADTTMEKQTLREVVAPLADERIGAVSGVIRGNMNSNPITWFQDFEFVLSAAWRWVYNNINSTYILPCLVAFKKEALEAVGGLSTDTLSEDIDIGLRLRKKGWLLTMAPKAVIHTNLPQTLPSLAKQRIRWGRGTLQVLRKHKDVFLNPNYGAIGLYGIPTQIYWFIHGLVVIPITAYQIMQGYFMYFVTYNQQFSYNAFRYFFGWLSAYGMIEYAYRTLTGVYAFTTFFLLVLISFALNITYTTLGLIKFEGRPDVRHFIAFFFFFPYSVMVMLFYIWPLLKAVVSRASMGGVNKWEKAY